VLSISEMLFYLLSNNQLQLTAKLRGCIVLKIVYPKGELYGSKSCWGCRRLLSMKGALPLSTSSSNSRTASAMITRGSRRKPFIPAATASFRSVITRMSGWKGSAGGLLY